MFIEKIKIANFGKLSNMNIVPSPNLNVIYGPNESGKSTLLSFIKFIFYGSKHKKAFKDLTFKERYMSWQTMSMEGSCNINTYSGSYIIKRTENANISSLNVVNTDTGEDKTIDKPGENFIGVDSGIFKNTFFISGIPVISETSSKSELISFLTDSYNDTNTYSYVKSTLNDNISNILSTRRKDSVISYINADINSYKEDLRRLEIERDSITTKGNDIVNLENLINKTEKRNNTLKIIKNEIQIKNDLKKLVEEKETIENKLLCSDKSEMNDEEKKLLVDNFEHLIKQISFYSKSNFKQLFLFLFSCFISASSFISVFKNSTYWILFLLAVLISAIFGVNYFKGRKLVKKSKKAFESAKLKQSQLRDKLNLQDLSECLLYLSSNNRTLPLHNRVYLEERLKKIDNEINIIKRKLYDFVTLKNDLDDIDINSFTNCNLDDIIKDTEKTLIEYKKKLSSIIHYKNSYGIVCNEIKNVKSKLEELYQKKYDAESEASLYSSSLDILETAFLGIKESLIPEILETTNKVFNDICDTNCNLVNLTDDFEITINTEDFYKSSKYLSSGANDALYFSLRIAIINLFVKEKYRPPVFIDDIFSNMDDVRAEKVMNIIYKLSDKYQIFVCTCRKRELNFFENKSNVNIIRL